MMTSIKNRQNSPSPDPFPTPSPLAGEGWGEGLSCHTVKIFGAVISLMILCVVSQAFAHEKPHAAPPLKKDASHGEKLYNEFSCISCHGAKGEGMDGPPLGSDAFKKKYPKDEDLKKVIINGLPPKQGQAAVMVGLGDAISESELKDLISYIRHLKPVDASKPANHQH